MSKLDVRILKEHLSKREKAMLDELVPGWMHFDTLDTNTLKQATTEWVDETLDLMNDLKALKEMR